jgi:hypothetical protein
LMDRSSTYYMPTYKVGDVYRFIHIYTLPRYRSLPLPPWFSSYFSRFDHCENLLISLPPLASPLNPGFRPTPIISGPCLISQNAEIRNMPRFMRLPLRVCLCHERTLYGPSTRPNRLS